MSEAGDLRQTIRLTVGDTESEWQVTTALANQYEQGVTIIQYAAGMPKEAIEAIHRLIETALEAISGSTS